MLFKFLQPDCYQRGRRILALFLCLSLATSLQAQTLPFKTSFSADLFSANAVSPIYLKGMTLNAQKPFELDFLIDVKDPNLATEEVREEVAKLVKYFMASLTTPEREMWVNLSPGEGDQIIPRRFGKTQMGNDLLRQDYLLKQITAALLQPQGEVGQKIWKKIAVVAQERYGSADIPVEMLSRVWIVPDYAKIYVHDQTVMITDSRLKVMLEDDYKAATENESSANPSVSILRELLIPALEDEVNHGEVFANLRQIYQAMILAVWFKNNLRDSVLGQSYVDRHLVDGIDNPESDVSPQEVYENYLNLFEEGTKSLLEEEYSPEAQTINSRQYITGGYDAAQLNERIQQDNSRRIDVATLKTVRSARIKLKPFGDTAMLSLAPLPKLLVQLQSNGASIEDRRKALATLESILTRIHQPGALAFDIGGVLVGGHHRTGIKAYLDAKKIQYSKAELDDVHHRIFKEKAIVNQNYAAFKIGQATMDQFLDDVWKKLLVGLGDRLTNITTEADFRKEFMPIYYQSFYSIKENEEVVQDLLDMGIPIYALSNNFGEKIEYLRSVSELLSKIDIISSHEVGASKPSPAIYKELIRRVQAKHSTVKPSEIIFFDDKEENLAAGDEEGISSSLIDVNTGTTLADNEIIREIREQSALYRVIGTLRMVGKTVSDDLQDEYRGVLERLEKLSQTASVKRPRLSAIAGFLNEWKAQSPTNASLAQGLNVREVQQSLFESAQSFIETREDLKNLKSIQYSLVLQLTRSDGMHYDRARKIVSELLQEPEDFEKIFANGTEGADADYYNMISQGVMVNSRAFFNRVMVKHFEQQNILAKLKKALLPELMSILNSILKEQYKWSDVIQLDLSEINTVKEFQVMFEAKLRAKGLSEERVSAIHQRIGTWERDVEGLAQQYIQTYAAYQASRYTEEFQLIAQLKQKSPGTEFTREGWYDFISWMRKRLYPLPEFKDLSKPTIVLVAGAAGVGKSTVSQYVTNHFRIPTYFSSDVLREASRSSLQSVIGDQEAIATFPEFFGSSFEGPNLGWYYAHSMMTMEGVEGAINRLVKEGTSGVIEGVPLIPGLLDEEYFHRANIVWIVIGIEDKEIHFERFVGRDAKGLDRGGSGRYRNNFEAIRQAHDRLVTLARRTDALVIYNDLNLTHGLEKVAQRVGGIEADNGIPVQDTIRQQVHADLERRKKQYKEGDLAMAASISLEMAEQILMNEFVIDQTSDVLEQNPGGIDFNPGYLALETYGEQRTIPMPLSTALEGIPLQGLYPVIINVSPIIGLPQLLGLDDQNAAPSLQVSQL